MPIGGTSGTTSPPAVMATVTANGRPVSVATWYLIEDDGLLMLCMNADRARLKHLQNNGHVSLTVLAADDFGTHVSVQGHVVSIKPDEGLADIDRWASSAERGTGRRSAEPGI